jgi:subtilisin family serine protease
MKARVISKLNKRLWPSTKNTPLPNPLIPNDVIEVLEEVEGEAVIPTNNKWYKTNKGFYVWSGGLSGAIEATKAKSVILSDTDSKKLQSSLILNQSLNFSGKNVKVALLDTGISSHPALAGKIDSSRSKSYIPGEASADDDLGHGTAIAGIIVGNDSQIEGLATDGSIINFRIASSGFVNSNALYFCLKDIVEGKYGEIDLVNLSLDCSSAIIDAIQILVNQGLAKGIIIVVADGESSERNNISTLKNVIKVSVANVSYLSQQQAKLDYRRTFSFLNQPIKSCSLNNKYSDIKNDSAYTAVMTGIVASIIAEKNFNANANRLEKILAELKSVSFDIKSEKTIETFKPFNI